MRTLRQIHSRIQAIPLRNAPSMMISAIFGAYLSLQLVSHGGMVG